jgi:hypothetical protein
METTTASSESWSRESSPVAPVSQATMARRGRAQEGCAGSAKGMQARAGRSRNTILAAFFLRYLILPVSGMLLSAAVIIIPVSHLSIKPGDDSAGMLPGMLIVRRRRVILYHCSFRVGHCL